jgi:hypothetical protein
MSNEIMAVTTKKINEEEGQELKTLVSISAPPANRISSSDILTPTPTGAFRSKLVAELHDKGKFSILSNPNASTDVVRRTNNMLLSLNHAVEVDADIVICVTCRDTEPPRELALKRSEKGFKPIVNVLSRELVDTRIVCKGSAYVRKFPAEMESSVLEVMEGLADKGLKRVTPDIIDKKFEEKSSQESTTHHFIRKTLGGISISDSKLIFEIEVFPRNPEETDVAAHECAGIISTLREFSSRTKDKPDYRLFAD